MASLQKNMKMQRGCMCWHKVLLFCFSMFESRELLGSRRCTPLKTCMPSQPFPYTGYWYHKLTPVNASHHDLSHTTQPVYALLFAKFSRSALVATPSTNFLLASVTTANSCFPLPSTPPLKKSSNSSKGVSVVMTLYLLPRR